MKQISVYIVLNWFWEGDSNLIGTYTNCFATHNEAKIHVNETKNYGDISKIIDCDTTWNWWDEDGQYGSPGIVQIIKKTFELEEFE